MDPRYLTLLRIHDACQGMSREEINLLAAEVDVVLAEAGQHVHSAGETIDSIYIVVSGRMKMVAKTPTGESRTVRFISAGDQFGALMLFSDGDLPLDIMADEKSVLLRLPKEAAQRLCSEIPSLRRNLLKKIGYAVQDSMRWRRIRTVSKLVAFLGPDQHVRSILKEVVGQLDGIGERIGIIGEQTSASPKNSNVVFKPLLNQAGEYLDPDDVRAIIEKLPDFDRVFLLVDRLYPTDKRTRLVEMSDQVFCIADPDDTRGSIDHLRDLIRQSPSANKKTHFVWQFVKEQQVAPLLPELATLVKRDFKVPLLGAGRQCGIERIVHYLRDVSIGLALSGGAAHGMAHLGVLRALEEAGITVDRIAGTSAGTLTGVTYCAGITPDEAINAFTHDLEPGRIYKWFPKGDGMYLLEKYRTHGWDPMLRKYLHDWQLEQLPTPCCTVTTDLIGAEQVQRNTGDAVHSILESINLPVLSPPIRRDGKLLVDGGIVNNLPANVLVNQGCNFVIGVDVAAHVENEFAGNTAETPTDEMKSPGIVATLLRCLRVQAHNMSAVGAQGADVIIAPDVSDFEPTAFTKTAEMAEIGYQATMEMLPRIREILHKLDRSLFAKE